MSVLPVSHLPSDVHEEKTMFERFSERARRVVVLAQEEARRLDHNYIGSEHLLLGLLHEGEGIGGKVLSTLGISLDGVRAGVEEVVGRGGDPALDSGHIPFTPRAKRVMELSLREAIALGHNYIGTEHQLLGILREGGGVAARLLADRGVTYDRAHEQVLALLRGAKKTVSVPPLETTTAEEAPSVAVEGPVCPTCTSSLREHLKAEKVDVNGKDEPVTVLYCDICGRPMGTA